MFAFPPEIEDKIFEWAAVLVPADARHLAVVCKRVQTCVEYIMYESLLFSKVPYKVPESAIVERFAYTLEVRPAEFFATRVQNICFTFNVKEGFAKSVVTKCTGARCVAFWIITPRYSGYGALFLPLASTLVGISMSKYTVNELAASGVIFPHVQYLGLLGWAGREPLLPLDWLPNLLVIQMDVNNTQTDQWLEDAKLAISTTFLLDTFIFDVDAGSMDEVKSRKSELGDGLDRIHFRNLDDHHVVNIWRGFAYNDDMFF